MQNPLKIQSNTSQFRKIKRPRANFWSYFIVMGVVNKCACGIPIICLLCKAGSSEVIDCHCIFSSFTQSLNWIIDEWGWHRKLVWVGWKRRTGSVELFVWTIESQIFLKFLNFWISKISAGYNSLWMWVLEDSKFRQ